METTRTLDKNIDRLSHGAHQAVERASQKGEELMEMKDNWIEGASEYVREHPIAALGIAAAAGYLFSVISRWR